MLTVGQGEVRLRRAGLCGIAKGSRSSFNTNERRVVERSGPSFSSERGLSPSRLVVKGVLCGCAWGCVGVVSAESDGGKESQTA